MWGGGRKCEVCKYVENQRWLDEGVFDQQILKENKRLVLVRWWENVMCR